jgi:hypothetical protein
MGARFWSIVVGSLFAFITLIVPDNAMASGGEMRSFHFFGGVGLKYLSLDLAAGTSKSNFSGWATIGDLGFRLPFGQSFALEVGGAVSQGRILNNMKSSSYVETGFVQTSEARAGLYYGILGLGGGMRNNQIRVKGFGGADSATESDYTGKTSFGYLNLNFDYQQRLRTVVEAQYQSGNIGEVRLNEASAALKLLLLLGF